MSAQETLLSSESVQTLTTEEPIKKSKEVDSKTLWTVILASCVGTLIEWYDFFVYGSLSSVLASKFYKTNTPTGDTIAFLASFAVGFIVRPFGALVFGFLGDRVGRKYTFMVTLILMGLCTFLVGCIPTIDQMGVGAGIILIILRIIQGLAIGGEFGGAATYIAEHAPNHRRGYYTSFLQITATAGLLLSLVIIVICRVAMGEARFSEIGWRIPFWLSAVLLAVSIYIRLRLKESPLFTHAKEVGLTSKNPLKDSFTKIKNLKLVALALFGATMGQGVVWYTGQFYALTFLSTLMKVPLIDSYVIVLVPLIIASPFFVLVGHLSDKYGRRIFIRLGLFLACCLYYPIYIGMYRYRYFLSGTSGPLNPEYNRGMLGFLVFIQVMLVPLVYGPISAFLVELFPTQIRYTSMSLPYHIGNGVFGGLVPFISVSMVVATGNNLAGTFFPIGIAGLCLIINLLFVPETKHLELDRHDENVEIRLNKTLV